jgi:hypothetical protein
MLEGKNVLPHRIHWLARPKGGSLRIAEVDFLIDGRTSWIENTAPYSYGDDGNWLVTSALSPGKAPVHGSREGCQREDRTEDDGRPRRRCGCSAAPLAAAWQRLVTPERRIGDSGGLWMISVDAAGWSIKDPQGYENWIRRSVSRGRPRPVARRDMDEPVRPGDHQAGRQRVVSGDECPGRLRLGGLCRRPHDRARRRRRVWFSEQQRESDRRRRLDASRTPPHE